jgi:hypothetical protein
MYLATLRARETRSERAAEYIETTPVLAGSVCFARGWAGFNISGGPRIDLDERRGLALAELLQVLSCGEESATASFEDLAYSCDRPAARSALLQIAADERRHQFLLAALSAGLPGPRVEPAFKVKMRRFFMRLADRDLQVHFVRIAALDSAACQLLALLRARTGPLPIESKAAGVLRSIHMDEARHVRLARRSAGPIVDTRRGMEIAAEVQFELAQLIRMRAASLEALSIDPDRLNRRLGGLSASSEAERCRA